ncbi:MAG: hypothetical protein ACJAQ7_002317, partial [Sediminicola sp.]
ENEVKAIGITGILIWRKNIPTDLTDIMKEVGENGKIVPPSWV